MLLIGAPRSGQGVDYRGIVTTTLTIVSKDADFRQLIFLHRCPPKVVWLRVGNRSTDEIHTLIRAHNADLSTFDAEPVAAC